METAEGVYQGHTAVVTPTRVPEMILEILPFFYILYVTTFIDRYESAIARDMHVSERTMYFVL